MNAPSDVERAEVARRVFLPEERNYLNNREPDIIRYGEGAQAGKIKG